MSNRCNNNQKYVLSRINETYVAVEDLIKLLDYSVSPNKNCKLYWFVCLLLSPSLYEQ